jgi:hypothetical protein
MLIQPIHEHVKYLYLYSLPQSLSSGICSIYLKQTKMYFFSFIKSENRRVEQVFSGEVGTSQRRQEVEEGCGKVNMVQILRTLVCKWKNENC